MNTEITTKLIQTPAIDLASEVEYDLKAEDYVAYWRFLASESPQHLPRSVVDASEGVVERFHRTLAFGLVCLCVWAMLARFGDGPLWTTPIMILFVAFNICNLLVGLLRSKRAGIYLNDFPVNPWRWAYMRCLRNLAREEAIKGRTPLLDILSHYRFARKPEGFTLTAEYQQSFGDSLVTLCRRQDEVAWRAVEVVGFALAAKHYHEARNDFIVPSGSTPSNDMRLTLPRS